MRISDWSSDVCSSDLFSAATSEFKNLEFFYFHNCPYEGVWKDNKRRFTERTPTAQLLHKFGHDYKLAFVGDASMSPYEITHPGGSVEHMNEEAGAVWMRRLTNRSEEHTSELQSLMRISYAVFCLKKKTKKHTHKTQHI